MISVLLATYNDERFIKESVESVLKQTYSDFELLIGFNGTKDGSKAILSKMKDDRIRIFDYGNDVGKSKTLNKMLKEARGEWVAIQDGDDVWLPNKLEKQIQYMSDCDVIGTYIKYINTNGQIIGGPNLISDHDNIIKQCLNKNNQIANSSAIFKIKHILEIGGWDEDIDGVEDFDLWLKLIKLGCTFYNVPEICVLHRLHTNSNFNAQNGLQSGQLNKLFNNGH